MVLLQTEINGGVKQQPTKQTRPPSERTRSKV